MNKFRPHDHPNVAVIGLDAGDWTVLDSLINGNKVPNIARIAKAGMRASMVSTIPDMTPPAWTSMVTGVNPGRHNVFGFSQPFGYNVRLTSNSTRGAPTIWEVLDEECTKLVVNVPMTYPIRRLNGCVVADSLTLVRSGEWVWPREEMQGLLRMGYDKCLVSHISEVKGNHQLLVSASTRGRVFLELMNRYHPCFAMIVFSETDWVQHISPDNPDRIASVYTEIDHFVGELRPKLKPDTVIMLVSDHGFRVAERKFLVNNWLIQNALLRPRRRNVPPHGSIVDAFANRAGMLLPILVRSTPRRLREKLAPGVSSPTQNVAMFDGVYHSGWDLGQYLRLYLTEDERERYEEVYRRLNELSQSLIDTKTGQNPIRRVLRKGEVYSGRYVVSAPDFILELNHPYSGNERILKSGPIFLDLRVGVHRKDGIFLAQWNDSAQTSHDQSSLGEISIYDVAPSIARIYGKAIPSDGKIISILH